MDVPLTFDNGPEPAVTPRVLDVLGQADIKATFFMLGSKLADPERRAIAKRAHAEGHWIGNHTWSHQQPLGQLTDPALLVLHDLPTGAMTHLERFLDLAVKDGARFVLDLPDSCVPIRRGDVVGELAGYVAA